jgi:hypothetical protein
MHSLSGVPIAAAISIVPEAGKLAGSSRSGAASRAQPGAAALELDASFRARLQTMFGANSRAMNAPEPESQTELAIPDSQESSSRNGTPTPQSIPARSAPVNLPRARLLPQSPSTRKLAAIPGEAAQNPATAAPEPAPSRSSAQPQRPVRETTSHTGAAVASSAPPTAPHVAALPQVLAVPSQAPASQAPVPQLFASSPHAEDDNQPFLARAANSDGVTSVSNTISEASVSIPSFGLSREHSTPSALPQTNAAHSAVAPATPSAKSDVVPAPGREDAPPTARTTASAVEPAAALTPAPDSQEDLASELRSTAPVAPAEGPSAERPVKSQPARAAAPTPTPTAVRGPATATAPQPVPFDASPAAAKTEQSPRASNVTSPGPSFLVQHAASQLPLAIAPAHAPIPLSARESASSAGSSIPARADTFAALDAEPAAPRATWNYAGPTRAEAGYLDSSLGWVAVRAGVSGNTLHAAIVPASSEAAQALGSHLDGLNTYLADHRVATSQLSIAPPQSGQSYAGHSGFHPSGQQNGQEQHGGQSSAAPSADSTGPHATDSSSTPAIAGLDTPAAPVWSGGHISVIA